MELSELVFAGTTLAASFGGYFLAGLNEARRDRRTSERERRARAEDARLRRDEDRHRAQLEALKALQEDVQKAARHCGRALFFDHMQARAGRLTQLPDEWSEEELANRMSLARNASRVLDDDVRAAVHRLSDLTADIARNPQVLEGLSGDALEAAAVTRMYPLGPAVIETNEVIGAALRRELAWEPTTSAD